MYGKHFASMYTGSMVGCGTLAFALWGYCIANSDEEGFVELHPALLATIFGGTTEKEIEAQIDKFSQPDPKSRTPDQEGRRLEPIKPFLYCMVNYPKYRAIRDKEERKEYMRKYMRAYRRPVNNPVNNCKHSKPQLAQAEAEEEVDLKKETKKERKERTDWPYNAFHEFWTLWPGRYDPVENRTSKTGKAKAEVYWWRLPKAVQERIMELLKTGAIKARGTRYLPDAFRWLQDKGWEDFEIAKPPPPKRLQPQQAINPAAANFTKQQTANLAAKFGEAPAITEEHRTELKANEQVRKILSKQ